MNRGALHWSQHWWGLWDTPFKQHTHTHTQTHTQSPGLTKSCKLHRYYDPAGEWERGRTAREKMRETEGGRVEENVLPGSLWMPVVIDRCMMVHGKHHGAFPVCKHIQSCRSASIHFLSSLAFLLKDASPELPPSFLPRRPLQHFIRPSSLTSAASSIKTLTSTDKSRVSDIMLHVIRTTTLVFGCNDPKPSA